MGEKYEPVSNDLYCYRMKAKTFEFGMIPHKSVDLNFLGASTDGIAVSPEGKLTNIEIKSPFSRHITGIPKPEYWAQMQLQMEILNLDETHFIESKFREFSLEEFWKVWDKDIDEILAIQENQDSQESLNDQVMDYDAEGDALALCEADHAARVKKIRNQDKLKGDQVEPLRQLIKALKAERGIMIEAVNLEKEENDGTPKRMYISSPIHLYKDMDGLKKWYENQMAILSTSKTLVYLRSHGWIVERFSCVHVERDKAWFKNQIKFVQDFWKEVLDYRAKNLSIEQLKNLEQPLTTKYRAILGSIANKSKVQRSKSVPSSDSRDSRDSRSSSFSGSEKKGPMSKFVQTITQSKDDDSEDSELPLFGGGCLLDAGSSGLLISSSSTPSTPSTPSSSSTPSSNLNNALNSSTGIQRGFGCLLGGNTSGSNTPKKKVNTSKKFF